MFIETQSVFQLQRVFQKVIKIRSLYLALVAAALVIGSWTTARATSTAKEADEPEAADSALSPSSTLPSSKTFAPIIAYNSTYKLIFGLGYFEIPQEKKTHFLGVQLYGTFENVFEVAMKYKQYSEGPLAFSGSAKYSTFYSSYYGEGFSTRVEDKTKLFNRKSQLRPEVSYRLPDDFKAGSFLEFRSREETSVDGDSSIEYFPNESAVGLGLFVNYDSRNKRLNPTEGSFAELSIQHNPKEWSRTTGATPWSQTEIDLRHFHGLGTSVLAFHLAAGTSSGEPSYQYRYSLGGSSLLRGFNSDRFRGKHFYCGQLEGHFVLKPERFDGVIFTDVGSVTEDYFRESKSTVGAGIRYALPPSRTMRVRLDVGFASDQTGVSLAFGEVF